MKEQENWREIFREAGIMPVGEHNWKVLNDIWEELGLPRLDKEPAT